MDDNSATRSSPTKPFQAEHVLPSPVAGEGLEGEGRQVQPRRDFVL